jgi:RNA polymerase sigma factor (sigma-70 family)
VASVLDTPAGTTDDAGDLIRRAGSGDRAALRRLYETYAPRMTGVALRMLRSQALAEDAVHDAFVRVWRSGATFDPARGAGEAWLYAVLRHRALNILRARGRENPVDDEVLARVPDGADAPDARLAVGRLPQRLRRCLEELDEPRRRSILLAYVDGYSHSQIAQRLGEPIGTVKSWVRRGMDALRGCLG